MRCVRSSRVAVEQTWLLLVLVVLLGIVGGLVLSGAAPGAGPGGWNHVGTGVPATSTSLNGAVNALHTSRAGCWSAERSRTRAAWPTPTTSRGGTAGVEGARRVDARRLGERDRVARGQDLRRRHLPRRGRQRERGLRRGLGRQPVEPACNRPAAQQPRLRPGDRRLDALRRRHVPERRRDPGRRLPRRVRPRHGRGARAPSAAPSRWSAEASTRSRPTAAGGSTRAAAFARVAGIAAANKVAYLDGSGWHALGSGPRSGGAALGLLVRSLAADGTDVYVGTDSVDIAGIPQADHVAKWNGSAWSALGSDTSGGDGWFPTHGVRLRAAVVRLARLRRRRVARTRTATRLPTGSRSSTARAGGRSARTAPATARSTALSTRSRPWRAALRRRQLPQRGGDRLRALPRVVPARAAPPGGSAPTTTDDRRHGRADPPPTATDDGDRRSSTAGRSRPARSRTARPSTSRAAAIVLRTNDRHPDGHAARAASRPMFRLARGTDGKQPVVELRLARRQLRRLPEAQDERRGAGRADDDRAPALGRRQGPVSGREAATRRRRFAARTGSPPTAATARSCA